MNKLNRHFYGAFFMEGQMAKIGVGNVLSSYAQSAGWKALNQLINANSRFGIFDARGNAFYEKGLSADELQGLAKYFKVLSVDTSTESGVTALNYSKNYNVTTAPVESSKSADGQIKGGRTMAYNLVEQPRQGQITYVSTGTEKQRKFFETALETAQSTTTLYELHTAERTMKNIKITGYSVNRSPSQGAQMVQYQITFQEILVVLNTVELSGATDTYNNSKAQGQLETNTPSGSQFQAAKKKQ
ncbi:unnamed protein product [Commensalibacter papalotli (ex Botero et al. 2024)]|uniref:Dit-like phage tail protein N-terminal domain-containing protein n=2 Tax=Commensalibacter papalotli (ex Botero et al. 2024) TaxID=2972766 RepID=A0ABM9HL64_9PROT|nr:unnamed protein product [Commensalibacter papalotli (ex Botero et al. 2024)]CAI3946764.1 unnamed protein product [Commensalibacter papalotli (ex Botero et al. 2024)]